MTKLDGCHIQFLFLFSGGYLHVSCQAGKDTSKLEMMHTQLSRSTFQLVSLQSVGNSLEDLLEGVVEDCLEEVPVVDHAVPHVRGHLHALSRIRQRHRVHVLNIDLEFKI